MSATEWMLGNESNECCDVDAGPVSISLSRHDRNTGALVISREEMLRLAHLVIAAPELLAEMEATVRMAACTKARGGR